MTIYNKYIIKRFAITLVSWILVVLLIIIGITQMNIAQYQLNWQAKLQIMLSSSMLELCNIMDVIVICATTSYFLTIKSSFNFLTLYLFGLSTINTVKSILIFLLTFTILLIFVAKPILIKIENNNIQYLNNVKEQKTNEQINAKLKMGVKINLINTDDDSHYMISGNATIRDTDNIIILNNPIFVKYINNAIQDVIIAKQSFMLDSKSWIAKEAIVINNKYQAQVINTLTLPIGITKSHLKENIKHNMSQTIGAIKDIYSNMKIIWYDNISISETKTIVISKATKDAMIYIAREICLIYKIMIYFTISMLLTTKYTRNFNSVKAIVKVFCSLILFHNLDQLIVTIAQMTNMLAPFIIIATYSIFSAICLFTIYLREWHYRLNFKLLTAA